MNCIVNDSVLTIGCGSPTASAIMSMIITNLFSVEWPLMAQSGPSRSMDNGRDR
jgi:protein-L-isoaspartate O-methyltransferase